MSMNNSGEKPLLFPIQQSSTTVYAPSSGVMPFFPKKYKPTNTPSEEGTQTGMVVAPVAIPPPILYHTILYEGEGDCWARKAIGWGSGNLVERGMSVTLTYVTSSHGVLSDVGKPNKIKNAPEPGDEPKFRERSVSKVRPLDYFLW